MINIHTIHAAQEGDEDAIQQIFESFKQLMIFKTKKYFFHGGDREDVMQEAMIGLLKAINAYDENKNASFTTFALLCIKRQIITALKNSNSGKNRILTMAVSTSSDDEDEADLTYDNKSFNFYNPEEIYLSKEKMKYLNKYLKTHLSPMENEIFEYMLAEMTYTEIAEKTGRELKSVDNSIQRIKKKLKTFIEEYEKE